MNDESTFKGNTQGKTHKMWKTLTAGDRRTVRTLLESVTVPGPDANSWTAEEKAQPMYTL
jgi:hypothetical protein